MALPRWQIGGMAIIFLVLAIPLANWALVDLPVQSALSSDERNSSISIHAYHRLGMIPGSIVVDLWNVEGNASMADVTRALFTTADALKDRNYERVYLAFRGEHRFFVSGQYFHGLGSTYAYENPVYLMRTLPENVYRLDGHQAYGSWTGGMLGVLGRQMEDLNQFHREWYLEDLLSASLPVRDTSARSV